MNDSDKRNWVFVAVLVAVGVLVVLPVLLMAVMMGGGMMVGGMMGGWRTDAGSGNYWWNWVLMLLFWVLLIGGVGALVAWAVRRVGPPSDRGASRPDEAMEILKQRYARGEITAEQFEQIKRDLTS
jgi:putative membrane protein